jgi:chromosome segregation ATPase
LSSAELTARATTAAQIDNESLQEQVSHLQLKVAALEDQLHDARAASEAQEQGYAARLTRFREGESQLRKELEARNNEVKDLSKAEAAAKARVEEVTIALQESDSALEDARAEIETLRSDMAVGMRPGLLFISPLNCVSRCSRELDLKTQSPTMSPNFVPN